MLKSLKLLNTRYEIDNNAEHKIRASQYSSWKPLISVGGVA